MAVGGDNFGYLGCLLVGCWDSDFGDFYSLCNFGRKRWSFGRGLAVSPGMALVVGIAQPFMQPQVNTLQSFCFVCASSEIVKNTGEAAR